jgi:hypothetical protein
VKRHGEVLGTHSVEKAHPCKTVNEQCYQVESSKDTEPACLQENQEQCLELCDKLNLLDSYADACRVHCFKLCSPKDGPSPKPNEGGGLSGGAIAGIVIGCLAALAAVGFGCFKVGQKAGGESMQMAENQQALARGD